MTENLSLRSAAEPSSASNDPWRKEIHARVAGYRTRRGRRIEGAFSMRFPFPEQAAVPAEEELQPSTEQFLAATEREGTAPEIAEATAELETATAVCKAEQPSSTAIAPPEAESAFFSATSEPPTTFEAYALQTEPPPPALPRPRPKRKVIAFPRPPIEAHAMHRLADPVLAEHPRILDVPEELEALPSTPFLDGLQFQADPVPAARDADHAELPFRPATIPQRLYAAAVDCALVGVALGLFAAAGYKVLPKLVITKPLILTAVMMPVLLWVVYQYVLLIYGGATAGMRMAGLCLKSFQGKAPRLNDRRNRVLGLYMSTASLAMGLLWAFVDIDALCWHDRISRTYLANEDGALSSPPSC